MTSSRFLPTGSDRLSSCQAPVRWLLGLTLALLAPALEAQTPADIATERAGYTAWLKTAPNSPLAAIAQQAVGTGLSLGPPDADIPLTGIAEHRVAPNGPALTIKGPGYERPISRGHPFRIGRYALYLSGTTPGMTVTVFDDSSAREPPGYYDYDSAMVFTGPLLRLESPQKIRVLASDGVEAEAVEVGSFLVPLGDGTGLRVLRVPVAGSEESDLEIFFQDQTNGHGSYPAGRFVSLVPAGDGKYRLDFNRARNPYCAYSPVFPCPAPWRGNVVRAEVRAGERYSER
jgi:hypothetical protein